MKIVAISDTHNQHSAINNLGSGDILIHAGDATGVGTEREVLSFLNWFSDQDFKHKIFVPGNHDFWYEKNPAFANPLTEDMGINLLIDRTIEVEGLKIHGSPVTPWFCDWAFNRDRGPEIREHWDLIPENLDILITHGPPHNILDQLLDGQKVGCEDLLDRILTVKPKVHIFGHIHCGYGYKKFNDIGFYNVAQCSESYRLENKPQRIEEFYEEFDF